MARMDRPLPFLYFVARAMAAGFSPQWAWEQVLFLIAGAKGFQYLPCGWRVALSQETLDWKKVVEKCEQWWADPANARIVETLVGIHLTSLLEYTPAERRVMEEEVTRLVR